MKLLFDEDTPEKLLRGFQPHDCTHINRTPLKGLKNGLLLAAAAQDFDVLVTADSNLYHQQTVTRFDLAVIVLRAFRTKLEFLLPAVPEVLRAIETIRPGEIVFVYADVQSELRDRRKGKGRFKRA